MGRERHTVLLEELEMLVEPVLQYRHSGVYDADRYASHDAPCLLPHAPIHVPGSADW